MDIIFNRFKVTSDQLKMTHSTHMSKLTITHQIDFDSGKAEPMVCYTEPHPKVQLAQILPIAILGEVTLSNLIIKGDQVVTFDKLGGIKDHDCTFTPHKKPDGSLCYKFSFIGPFDADEETNPSPPA